MYTHHRAGDGASSALLFSQLSVKWEPKAPSAVLKVSVVNLLYQTTTSIANSVLVSSLETPRSSPTIPAAINFSRTYLLRNVLCGILHYYYSRKLELPCYFDFKQIALTTTLYLSTTRNLSFGRINFSGILTISVTPGSSITDIVESFHKRSIDPSKLIPGTKY